MIATVVRGPCLNPFLSSSPYLCRLYPGPLRGDGSDQRNLLSPKKRNVRERICSKVCN
jgi:hypothetical protein